jgi:SAM-dependent methyltransferase
MGAVFDDPLRKGDDQKDPIRTLLAWRFLRGEGVEFGALHAGVSVPPDVRVRYADLVDSATLRTMFPDLDSIREPDFITDLETMDGVADESQDFIVANHVLEHTESPLTALKTISRRLKPGGVAYLALPDKRFTFDLDREVTPLSHLIRDEAEGPDWSAAAHYREWVEKVERLTNELADKEAARLLANRTNIHFHVWDPPAMEALFAHAASRADIALQPIAAVENGAEMIWILRRGATPKDAAWAGWFGHTHPNGTMRLREPHHGLELACASLSARHHAILGNWPRVDAIVAPLGLADVSAERSSAALLSAFDKGRRSGVELSFLPLLAEAIGWLGWVIGRRRRDVDAAIEESLGWFRGTIAFAKTAADAFGADRRLRSRSLTVEAECWRGWFETCADYRPLEGLAALREGVAGDAFTDFADRLAVAGHGKDWAAFYIALAAASRGDSAGLAAALRAPVAEADQQRVLVESLHAAAEGVDAGIETALRKAVEPRQLAISEILADAMCRAALALRATADWAQDPSKVGWSSTHAGAMAVLIVAQGSGLTPAPIAPEIHALVEDAFAPGAATVIAMTSEETARLAAEAMLAAAIERGDASAGERWLVRLGSPPPDGFGSSFHASQIAAKAVHRYVTAVGAGRRAEAELWRAAASVSPGSNEAAHLSAQVLDDLNWRQDAGSAARRLARVWPDLPGLGWSQKAIDDLVALAFVRAADTPGGEKDARLLQTHTEAVLKRKRAMDETFGETLTMATAKLMAFSQAAS